MAQTSLNEHPQVSVKQKSLRDLQRKLTVQLETDLIRLFTESTFFDLELVVDSESLLSHSCIVRTRAARFYTFITTQCCVSHSNLLTTVFIDNASVIYIKKFLENIYSSSFMPETENYVLKYLKNTKEANATNKILSPEAETFFTPKSSPSEFYKPFSLLATSQEEINLSLSQNNASVRSYYRIVSVDDCQSDFEKELAEQDELFKSLQGLANKKKSSTKPASLALSRPTKSSREPIKRLPHWRPKLVDYEISSVKKPKGKLYLSCAPVFIASSPEMDQNSTTPDSGLDLSSSAPIEADVSSSSKKELSVQPLPTSDADLAAEDEARLDAMERNMRECEVFIIKEKEQATRYKENKVEKLEIVEENGCPIEKESAQQSEELSFIADNEAPTSLPVLDTPPCSPRSVDPNPSNPPNSWQPSNSSNFFIDASSLLDEDEIASPPVSLTPRKIPESGDESASFSEVVDPLLEKRQGDLIFRTSIPHFSKHELSNTSRLSGGYEADLETEQVVPVVDDSESLEFENNFDSGAFESGILYSRSLPCVDSRSYSAPNTEPVVPVSLSQISAPKPVTIARAIDVPVRKISAECVPIVSGGVSPKDYQTSSHTGSPHLPRRHEQAPIISGGMDIVAEPPELRPKRHVSTGEAWVVDVSPPKPPGRRLTRGMSSGSESDGNGIKERYSPKEKSLNAENISSSSSDITQNFPVEKSASLGYFIDFDCGGNVPVVKPKKHRNDSSNLKQNMFSMFIDMKDGNNDSGAGSLTPKAVVESNVENEKDDVNVKANSGKKPFYMFIEAESPIVKRKSIPSTKIKNGTSDGPKSFSDRSETEDMSLTSLESADSKTLKSSSRRSSDERGEKDVWNWDNAGHQVQNTWTEPTSKNVQTEPKSNDVIFKKDSTFIIDGGRKPPENKAQDLQTVIEATPPKSPKPEESDSGVLATEESDDSFVRLADLDSNRKNPYMDQEKTKVEAHSKVDSGKKRQGLRVAQSSRMTQSIPESSWQQKRPSRIPEREKLMSQSIGPAVPTSAVPGGRVTISKSLSRLFPNLSVSSLSLARTQTSDISEPSSMFSSRIDPCGLEISTSETDVSTQGDGASRLGQDLLRMFLDEISPDVVVEVGGRRIKAHKCILSSRCQYFAAMLSGGWVESAGNVISMQGFSYSAVHFALCHIYSGESEIPDSYNIVELATLADLLCLEGLKEAISYNLRSKYCHSFHPPCPACIVGALDCMPVAADYGLEDLYRKCVRWTAKFFVKVWPTKAFASLRKEFMDKCLQYHIVHMTVENVLDTLLGIDKISGSLPSIRWAETVTKIVHKLQDAAIKFLSDHFSSILTSDNFLALGKDAEWSIERLERSLFQATNKLPPEQACWSHARLHSLLTLATSHDASEDMQFNESFIILLHTLSEFVQASLIKQAPRAARSKAWQQMEPELRLNIQEAACLILPSEPPQRRQLTKTASASVVNQSTFRNSTRAVELRQVKLAMTQQGIKSAVATRRAQPLVSDTRHLDSSKTKPAPAPLVRRHEVRKSQSTSAVREALKTQKQPAPRLADVKSRYLQPRSPRKQAPEVVPTNGMAKRTVNGVSSSDSSRNCSPAMMRAASARSSRRVQVSEAQPRPLSQLAPDDNMSTDSLATESSCGDNRRQRRGKENSQSEKSTPSLPKKTQSLGSFPATNKTMVRPKTTQIPRMENDKKRPVRKQPGKVIPQLAGNKSENNFSPRLPARQSHRAPNPNANNINGNVHNKSANVDAENNATVPLKPLAAVSRSGTFLKDEPTIISKTGADVV